jgi:hypothetical protein
VSWRLARALQTLRAQVDAAHPDRSKRSDGTIGDAAHRNRTSDHNPNRNGVVQAWDVTHDPPRFDAHAFAEHLRTAGDPRIKYLISNRRIWNPSRAAGWRPYVGANPHTSHMHIAVSDSPARYDDASTWQLPTSPPPSKDWFSMASEADLRRIVREELDRRDTTLLANIAQAVWARLLGKGDNARTADFILRDVREKVG